MMNRLIQTIILCWKRKLNFEKCFYALIDYIVEDALLNAWKEYF